MEIRFNRYKHWKQLKNELGFWYIDILPCVTVKGDRTFALDSYQTEICLSWLFWQIYIFLN
jgi:hypothetical protein